MTRQEAAAVLRALQHSARMDGLRGVVSAQTVYVKLEKVLVFGSDELVIACAREMKTSAPDLFPS